MPKYLVHRKPDANHAQIIADLRKMGLFVIDLSGVSSGVPDIAIRNKEGDVIFVEIKVQKKAALKKTQVKWLSEYPGLCGIVQSVDEAVLLSQRPYTLCLNTVQKRRLAQYYVTMTTKEVWLPTILEIINV